MGAFLRSERMLPGRPQQRFRKKISAEGCKNQYRTERLSAPNSLSVILSHISIVGVLRCLVCKFFGQQRARDLIPPTGPVPEVE